MLRYKIPANMSILLLIPHCFMIFCKDCREWSIQPNIVFSAYVNGILALV